MNAGLDSVPQFLQSRCEAIAAEWQQAIASTGFVPLSEHQLHQRLVELAQQLVTLLFAEPFEPVQARGIGRALAQLHYIQPETLQRTQSVLGSQLVQGLSADQIAGLYPRQLALLSELSTGFTERVREVLLDEQEQIRRALVAERERAKEEIQELNRTLVRRVVERTEQLETANQDLQREVTARKRILETLQNTTRALQTLIQASPLAIIATDLAGNVRIWNPAAERIFGWTAGEVLAQPLPIVLEDGRAEYQTLRDVADREDFSSEVRYLRKDGTLIDVSISSARLYDTRGELTGYVAIMADITARKQAEATLRQYASELQARNEELDAFAHTVAHDLKSPLSNLFGYADALRADYNILSDEERQTYIRSMMQGAQKMDNIIDELLLLAGVRRMQIKIERLDMAGIVSEACRRLSFILNKEHAQVITPAAAWPEAVGYAPWVEEVWVNYISNAVKYGGTPSAAPRVELGGEVQPDGMARFWVRDNGFGLTQEQQTRLFTPFTQLNQVRARGHGLGLSIVRRIVEKLGGQVGVESSGVPGEGSLFYFTLPGEKK